MSLQNLPETLEEKVNANRWILELQEKIEGLAPYDCWVEKFSDLKTRDRSSPFAESEELRAKISALLTETPPPKGVSAELLPVQQIMQYRSFFTSIVIRILVEGSRFYPKAMIIPTEDLSKIPTQRRRSKWSKFRQ